MAIEASVLKAVKKNLGLGEAYTPFDADLLMYINSSFFKLRQLGVGPENGFEIEDETDTWAQFMSDSSVLNACKTFIYLNVRLLFDPPAMSFHVDAIKEQLDELVGRILLERSMGPWTTTSLPPSP